MSAASIPTPLSSAQLHAIGALLAGRSPADAARDCGISPRTLRNWQHQPGFRAALLAGQSLLLQQTCLQLAAAASEAVRTLVEICQDPSQKGNVRVAAAGKLLHFALRSVPSVAGTPDPLSVGEAMLVGETIPPPQPSQPTVLEKLSHLLKAAPAPNPQPLSLAPSAARAPDPNQGSERTRPSLPEPSAALRSPFPASPGNPARSRAHSKRSNLTAVSARTLVGSSR